MKKVQVFILTYNRPEFIINALESVIKQTYENIEIIVSDNSTNFITYELIKKNYSNLKYVHRTPTLEPIQHFNTILKEVTADYFMLFHDDDIMCNNMVSSLVNEINKNEKVVAVGTNAFVVVNNQLQNNLFRAKKNKYQIITNRTELARNYLINSIVPFPSYLYKKSIANKLVFNSQNGGKYTDVAFLLNLCDLGPIINLETPLMYYFFHKNQDSSNFDYFAISSLTNYIIKTTNYNRKDRVILRYRALHIYTYILNNLCDSSQSYFGWRNKKIILIMFFIYPFNYFIKLLIKLVYKKIINLLKSNML